MSAGPGGSVGRYRPEERIGGGGFGDVYRAFDPLLDRQVAIKILRAPESQAPSDALRHSLRGEPADPASDLFALGIILYEMATGRHPFLAEAPYATLPRIDLKEDRVAEAGMHLDPAVEQTRDLQAPLAAWGIYATLGELYAATRRADQARTSFGTSLQLLRFLAESSPEASPDRSWTASRSVASSIASSRLETRTDLGCFARRPSRPRVPRGKSMRVLGLCVVAAVGVLSCAREGRGPTWPAGNWTTSTPEEQGMGSAALTALDSEFASGRHGYIDGILIVRHGRAVFDRTYRNDYVKLFEGKDPVRGPYNYYDPDWHPWYRKSRLHTLQSVTKSVTSAAIGVAIARGEIPGVDVSIMKYFDEGAVADLDDRKRSIRLRDLLTMTAGLRWDEDSVTYTDPRNSCAAMEASADWVRYVIDQPMAQEPGKVFLYSSGVSQLLAHIILKATGMQVDAYAEEHLFRPIGIRTYYWKHTPTGLPDTEGGLYLTRQDLARFGYLYLHDGVWDGKTILPPGWIAETLKPWVAPAGMEATGVRYGYQWWLIPYGSQGARAATCWGYGGQFLFVVPEHDLVAVFNGWNIYDRPELEPGTALERVLQAIPPSGQVETPR